MENMFQHFSTISNLQVVDKTEVTPVSLPLPRGRWTSPLFNLGSTYPTPNAPTLRNPVYWFPFCHIRKSTKFFCPRQESYPNRTTSNLLGYHSLRTSWGFKTDSWAQRFTSLPFTPPYILCQRWKFFEYLTHIP